MIRCARCVMPETRPDLRIVDGVCSACRAYDARAAVDWSARKERFRRSLEEHPGAGGFDCIVASSGGKDSHFIALTMREWGYRPLLVSAETDFPTDLGRRNRENLARLFGETIKVTPDLIVRRKLNRLAQLKVGDMEWPEHALIFSIPVRIARDLDIGTVVYGESPQNDLSGGDADAFVLDRAWRERYGGLLGQRPADWVGKEGIREEDMIPYEWPDKAEAVRAVFLGQFVPWDGRANALLAQEHGFETYGKPVEGNLWDCENLDNAIIGIHYYMAFVKFGFGRATTTASLDIRHGRLERAEALALIREVDGRYPGSYLGVPLNEILREIGLSREAFDASVDGFANQALLVRDAPGHWRLRDP